MWPFTSPFPGIADPSRFCAATSPSDADSAIKSLADEREEGKGVYDYIICGGGTAGCVLASRLTEDPHKRVLLIEAGHSDARELFARVPGGWANLFKTHADWDYTSIPLEGANGREVYLPRGKMLGGCSSINALIYQRCAPSDYDQWESLGAKGWNFATMEPYFHKSENFTPSELFKDVDANIRGKGGLWHTSYPYTAEITKAFIASCAAAGIARVPDLNDPKTPLGVSRFQSIVAPDGTRSSAAAAWLGPKIVQSRKNLDILTGTTVTRLISDDDDEGDGKVKVLGVEVAQSRDGPRYVARAKHEVIVSQGAYGTPQLLLLSGIGPREQLESLGIKTRLDLAGVGARARDHPMASHVFKVKPGTSLQYLAHPLKVLPSLIRWLIWGDGPLRTNLAEAGAFVRAHEQPTAGQVATLSAQACTASGDGAPDLELITAPLYYLLPTGEAPKEPQDDYISIAPVVLRPTSEGSITLKSADPFDKAVIDPAFLKTEHDKKVMLEGVKLTCKVVQSEPLKSLVVESTFPQGVEAMTDDEILATLGAGIETIYHPCASCRIGERHSGGVVDPELKVHGVDGLRLCDASVFPEIVSGHPVATVCCVAERAADIIKGKI